MKENKIISLEREKQFLTKGEKVKSGEIIFEKSERKKIIEGTFEQWYKMHDYISRKIGPFFGITPKERVVLDERDKKFKKMQEFALEMMLKKAKTFEDWVLYSLWLLSTVI